MSCSRPAASVTAVVVNYNAGSALELCVASLEAAGAAQIFVVDNDSSDGSADSLARSGANAEVVRLEVNAGYGSAANAGAQRARSKYLAVLNPDVLVGAECLDTLAAVLDGDPSIGVVGPRISGEQGIVYPSARVFPDFATGAAHALVGTFFPHNRWSRRYRKDDETSAARDTDWLSGACLLVRKIAFDSIGGFDEGYFMYVEDLDLCWRLGRAGWRSRFEPAASVTHEQGRSTRGHPYKMLVAHHRSTLRFARKSLTGPKRALVPLVAVGLQARLVFAVAQKFWSRRRSGQSAPE